MIICIDQSPVWRARRAFDEGLSRVLEALFHSRSARRPASGLEVLLLASALDCSETTIEQYLAAPRKPGGRAGLAGEAVSYGPTGGRSDTRPLLVEPKVMPAYSPTKPA